MGERSGAGGNGLTKHALFWGCCNRVLVSYWSKATAGLACSILKRFCLHPMLPLVCHSGIHDVQCFAQRAVINQVTVYIVLLLGAKETI
jgi:hypothetical protein